MYYEKQLMPIMEWNLVSECDMDGDGESHYFV